MDTTDLLRARQSGPWSRVKLLDDGKMSYSMEGPPSLDIGRMTLEYCLTSPVIDREGDLILPDAPDWTDHERNPLTLFNHKLDQPFGKSQDTAGRYTVERRGDRWYGKSYLFQNDPFAEEVYRLAEKGALNGASIGFLPAKPPFGQSSVKKMNGYDYTVIERCKVFEWSAVYIPMNQDALLVAAEVVRKGLGNKPLSQRAMAMFSPFVGEAPVWANGWTKAAGWNESDHPRADDGKFGSGGGSGKDDDEDGLSDEGGDRADREKPKQRRAYHGEIGPNGEVYPGGAFIATKDMPKKDRERLKKDGSGKVKTRNGWEAAEPGMMSIMDKFGGKGIDPRNGEINYQFMQYMNRSPEYIKTVEEVAEKFKKGEDWISINEYPMFAGYADAARLFAADLPIPGAIMDLLPENAKKLLEKYKPKGEKKDAGAEKSFAPTPLSNKPAHRLNGKLKMYDDTDDQTQPPVDPIEAKADDQSPATPLGAQLIAVAHEIAMGLAKFYTDNVAQLEPELVQEFAKLEKTIMSSIAAMAQMFNGRYGDLPPLDGADWVDPDMDGDIDLTEDPVLNPDAEEDKAMAEGIQEDVIDGEDVTEDGPDATEDEVDATEDDEVEEEEEEDAKPRFKKSFEEAAKRSLKALMEGWQAKQKALKDAAKKIEHPDAVVAVKAAAQFLRTMAGDPREDKALRGRAKKLRSDLLNALPKVKAKAVVEIAPVALDIDLDKIADHFNSARKAMEVDAQAIQEKINKLFQLTGR